MTEVVWIVQIALFELDGFSIRHFALGCAVGAGERRKEIVEAAIFVNQHDHVIDVSCSGEHVRRVSAKRSPGSVGGTWRTRRGCQVQSDGDGYAACDHPRH